MASRLYDDYAPPMVGAAVEGLWAAPRRLAAMSGAADGRASDLIEPSSTEHSDTADNFGANPISARRQPKSLAGYVPCVNESIVQN